MAPAKILLSTLDIMDPRQAMRYYLTGETFGAPEASGWAWSRRPAPARNSTPWWPALVAPLLETSPQGAAETRKLLTAPRRQRVDALGPEMTELPARLFGSQEVQEGIRAFLDKRLPAWRTLDWGPARRGGCSAGGRLGLGGDQAEEQDTRADGV